MKRIVLYTLPVILLVSPLFAQAKMYKWVDEEGQMHFGDRIPEKYLVKEHQELNDQGLVTKRKEAAKTAEEKAEDRRLERERKKVELVEKKKKQRDRVLLDTYTTERDLIVARDSRLEAVDSQIQLSKTIIDDSTNKVDSMQKQVSQIKDTGREVPPDLYKRINGEKQQIEVQTKNLKGHKKRYNEILKQFNGYIERFKVLKDEQRAKRERILKERGG